MPRTWRLSYVWLSIALMVLALSGIGAVAWHAVPAGASATATPPGVLEPVVLPGPTVTPLPTAMPPPTSTPEPTAVSPTAPAAPTALPSPTPTWTPTPRPSPTAPPEPTPDGQVRRAAVPILMYHYISDPPPGADAYRLDLSVRPKEFEAQLAYLRAEGYESITLEDLLRHLTRGTPLPPKPIILTFDDGYLDNYLYAFPLLRQYQFKGTFFVVVAYLNEGTPGYMSWEQARLLQDSGMEVGSHSHTHVDLRLEWGNSLVQQTAGSREAIEAHLQKPVRFFCYPSGRYNQRTIDALRAAQYWGAVTTDPGAVHSSSSLFMLRRVRVHGGKDIAWFRDLLAYYTP